MLPGSKSNFLNLSTLFPCFKSFNNSPLPTSVFLNILTSRKSVALSCLSRVLQVCLSVSEEKVINFFLWLHWVFAAVHGLSLVAVSRGYSSLWCTGFSLWWLLLLWSMGSRHAGFSSCTTWAQ